MLFTATGNCTKYCTVIRSHTIHDIGQELLTFIYVRVRPVYLHMIKHVIKQSNLDPKILTYLTFSLKLAQDTEENMYGLDKVASAFQLQYWSGAFHKQQLTLVPCSVSNLDIIYMYLVNLKNTFIITYVDKWYNHTGDIKI